jgi:hypothetical protein
MILNCHHQAVSFVLMMASSRFHKDICEKLDGFPNLLQLDDGDATCKRNKFAIALGATGVVLPLIMALVTAKGMLRGIPEVVVSFVLAVMYAFGVGYITFGDGPGINIGNQYFSTWIGFILAFGLLSVCFREEYGMLTGEETAEETKEKEPEVKETEEKEIKETEEKEVEKIEVDEEKPEQPIVEESA